MKLTAPDILEVTHLRLTDDVPLDHPAFDELPRAEKERHRRDAIDALAAALYGEREAARVVAIARAEARAEAAARAAAELEQKIELVRSLKIETTEGKLALMHRIGAAVACWENQTGGFSAGFSDLRMTTAHARRIGSTRFRVDFSRPGPVAFVGNADVLDVLAQRHGMPPTTALRLPDGRTARLYRTGSWCRAKGFYGPSFQIVFGLEIDNDTTIEAVELDPRTGDLPALPSRIDSWLLSCENSPAALFDLLGEVAR